MSASQPPYRDIEALIRATYRECASTAFRIIRNHADAEDAIQSACIKVLLAWPKVSGFSTAGKQRAYLRSTARNEALQVLRKRKRRKECSDLGESEDPRIPERLAELARARKDLELALKVIDEMPTVRRKVVKLRMANYGYGEIAAMLDISVSTVRSHISDARKHLRQAMPGDGEGE
jgi:RNA polymerase sigma-70 factor, ECF subfamily